MKSFKQYISEASFKVNIPDMPPVYVDAKSAGEVKKKLRALLKKPMDVEVERVQPTQVKKAFRLRAQGKDEDDVQEEVELDELTDAQRAARERSRKDGREHGGSPGQKRALGYGGTDHQGRGLKKGHKSGDKGNYGTAQARKSDAETGKYSSMAYDKRMKQKDSKYGTNPRLDALRRKRDALKRERERIVGEEVKLDERRGRPRKDGTSSGDLESIQMQLRKSISLRGKKDVEFEDGKKVKVPEKVARQVLSGIDKMRQPKDKQIVVNYIMKSHKNLMDYAAGKVKMDDMDPEAKRRKLLGLK